MPSLPPVSAADVTLYTELHAVSTPARPRMRPNPEEDGPRYVFAPHALSLYDGHEELLVRTALIRSRDYEEGRRSPPRLTSSRDIAKLCGHLAHADQEFFVVIACDARLAALAIYEAARGGTSHANVELPHVLKVPLLTGGHWVVVVHNHPSGDSTPSPEDLEYTRTLNGALKCVGLRLVDHVIVSRGGAFSFVDAGLHASSD